MTVAKFPTQEPDQCMRKLLGFLVEAAPGEIPSHALYDKAHMFPGKFYPALSMLELNKLVTSRWGETDKSGRRTRLYKATDQGLRIFIKQGKESGHGTVAPGYANLAHG